MLLLNDRSLLDAFREGRPEALRAVYLHYLPRVRGQLRAGFSFVSRGRAMRFNGYRETFDLDGATQDVFVRALSPRARLGYDGLRPYGEYLVAIARNLVLNELRRKDDLFSNETDVPEESAPQAEELLEGRELDRLVEAFAATLKGQDEQYFRARFGEPRSQVEAAESMGISRIVARRMEARVKSELLDFMKSHGYLSSVSPAIIGSLAPVKP